MTDTKTLIEALRILARDIQSEDGVANAAIAEAADRLAKQQKRIRNQRREIGELAKDKHQVDGFVNWLTAEIKKTQPTINEAASNRAWALYEAKKQLEKLRNGLGEKPKCELCDDHGGLAITGPPGPRSPIVPCPRCNP